MDIAREIEVLIRAKFPIIYLVSWEEARVQTTLEELAKKLHRTLYSWSITQGIKPPLKSRTNGSSSLPPELDILLNIQVSEEFTIFLLKDYHPYLRDVRSVRILRDLASKLREKTQTLILVSPSLYLPNELEKDITVIEFPLPEVKEINEQLDQILEAVSENPNINTELSKEKRELIVHSALGLTLEEIQSSFARSFVEKKCLDISVVLEEKKQIVRKSGLLEYYPATEDLSSVGGLDLLKDWLLKRKASFSEEARKFGIPIPKGLLMLGVQGCGKSLVARTIASHWNLPMLKLDVGRIFGSLVGQSEENIRRAIRIAESVAPCILWADEFEKGFAGMSGGVSDSGTTARVFATFLTWMQEKTKPVFLVATANDVSALPPEILRKGRFDEIFFIDLPTLKERMEIFKIHLQKRARDPSKFKIHDLAKTSSGFNGAEIEQSIIGGLHSAFNAKRELNHHDILKELQSSIPLSIMMQEEMDQLRQWAHQRTRKSTSEPLDEI